ncbi:MAG: hypothetical protein DRN12_00795 [Thermoplasmata archaeon]|nr:MAG: hypothetical protein DRN12_00795 [Thermoplasmata archaeon]
MSTSRIFDVIRGQNILTSCSFNLWKGNRMDEDAVSEIVGILLLLAISIGTFSVVYYSILSAEPIPNPPPLDVIATIENGNITIIHMGGESVGIDTRLIVVVNGLTNETTIDDYLNSTEKENNRWDIGEKIIYPIGNVYNKQVDIKLVEPKSNSLILLTTLSG